MTEQKQGSVRTVEGVPVCDAHAAACRCAEPPGHEGPHACDRDGCAGAWLGEYGSDDFTVVHYPTAALLGMPLS